MKHKTIVLFIFLTFFLAYPPTKAKADISPPGAPPGGIIETLEEVPIRMVRERVVLDIQPITKDDFIYQLWANSKTREHFHTMAFVDAEFDMRNREEEAITMDVWFPLNDIYKEGNYNYPLEILDFHVYVDNQQLETQRLTIISETIDSIFNEEVWAVFEITFPPQQSVTVRVTYSLPPQHEGKNHSGGDFNYIFHTGAGWWGTIGEAELVVRFPYKASTEHIINMPSNGKIEGNEVSWIWKDFEPTIHDDFSITVLYPRYWQAVLDAREALKGNENDIPSLRSLADAYDILATEYLYEYNRNNGEYFAQLRDEVLAKAYMLGYPTPTRTLTPSPLPTRTITPTITNTVRATRKPTYTPRTTATGTLTSSPTETPVTEEPNNTNTPTNTITLATITPIPIEQETHQSFAGLFAVLLLLVGGGVFIFFRVDSGKR